MAQVVLSIAGSDSSGGAGIQADVKTAEAFGCFSATALTVATAQNTEGVTSIVPMSAAFVRSQLKAVFSDFSVSAIKVGMLYNQEIIEAVGEILEEYSGKIPIVLDPVSVSQAGSKLLDGSAPDALMNLFSLSDIVTPNKEEARLFLGGGDDGEIEDGWDEIRTRATELSLENRYALVVKNIHDEVLSTDYLISGGRVVGFSTFHVKNGQSHGTGCSFSTAIACGLANGLDLESAVSAAKHYIYKAMTHAPMIGRGAGPILHRVDP